MEALKVFTKRSSALDFFKKHYCRKTRNYLTSLVQLIITPQQELGWVAKNFGSGKMFFSSRRDQEIEVENLGSCQVIQPESVFLYKGKIFWYKFNKVTKDYSIIFVKIIHSITFAEQLYPNETFKFCLVKNKQNNIINCAWVSDNRQIPIFQDEPEYNQQKVLLDPLSLGDEFYFLGKRWYSCTEKGKCILAELPLH